MRHELLRPIGRDQRRHRDETAVALRESLPLPQIAVNNVVGVIDQCGRERLDAVAFGGRRCLGHASLPCLLNTARRDAAFFVVVEAKNKVSLPSPNGSVPPPTPPRSHPSTP